MRLAALYDIHGNLPALDAVLHEIQTLGVDRILVGGDVFPGPLARECLHRLLHLDTPTDFIHGNGESAVLTLRTGGDIASIPEQAHEILRWSAQQIDDDDQRAIASWPATESIAIPGIGEVLFCHATPRNDTEIFTRLTPVDRLLPVFEDVNAALVVCGHTHMQFDRTIGSTRVVNAGSVGMPFAEPGAYWLLLGPGIELRRTTYDLAAAADRIRQTRYPQAETFAAKNILQPPSEQEMVETFTRIGL